MRQEINLYRDALRPPQLVLPAIQIVTLVGVAAGLVLLLSLVTWVRLLGAQTEVASLQQAQQAQQARIAEITQLLASRQKSPLLAQQVARLEQELKSKQKLLKLVSGQSEGNTVGFSAHLAGLGRHQRDGLWFTRIGFTQGGVGMTLAGSTLDPQHLPVYLRALAAEPAFLGIEFDTFWMRRPEERARGQLDFVVATHCDAESGADCGGEVAR